MTGREEGRAVWATRDRAESAEARVKELEAEVRRLRATKGPTPMADEHFTTTDKELRDALGADGRHAIRHSHGTGLHNHRLLEDEWVELVKVASMAFDPEHPKYRDNLATKATGTIALRRLVALARLHERTAAPSQEEPSNE